MEFKGTKGKWKAVNCGKHWDNTTIDNIQVKYGKDVECISDHVYFEYDTSLIYKAPEMLEMLSNVREILVDVGRLQEAFNIDELIKQATEI